VSGIPTAIANNHRWVLDSRKPATEVLSDRERNMALSEKEKMLAGELYRSTDGELQAAMAEAQQYLRRLNAIPNEDGGQRFAVLQALLGQIGSGTQIKSPFMCDYGFHISIGRNGFVNYGCVFLDCNLITIGEDAQIGPGVHIYTAFHPVDAEVRLVGSRRQNLSLSGTTFGLVEGALSVRG
jgi:acetyltransferase-like isoleucine patch superfamily enzyme